MFVDKTEGTVPPNNGKVDPSFILRMNKETEVFKATDPTLERTMPDPDRYFIFSKLGGESRLRYVYGVNYYPDRNPATGALEFPIMSSMALIRPEDGTDFQLDHFYLRGEPDNLYYRGESVDLSFDHKFPARCLISILAKLNKRGFMFNYSNRTRGMDAAYMQLEDTGTLHTFLDTEQLGMLETGQVVETTILGYKIISRLHEGYLTVKRLKGSAELDILSIPWLAPLSAEVTPRLVDRGILFDPEHPQPWLDSRKGESIPEVLEAVGINWERHDDEVLEN